MRTWGLVIVLSCACDSAGSSGNGELIDAGVAAITFGTGAGGQTNLATDGDQFKTAAAAYMASPTAL